jgi:hypothetical protein
VGTQNDIPGWRLGFIGVKRDQRNAMLRAETLAGR